MPFTDSQNQAIETSGTNILVSASAGSGKTGVLKERVIQKVSQGTNIDEMIILTFTKAAAAEMKTRILKDLNKLNLSDQILRVNNAIISTFDAFSLRVVSEYHYLLDLDQDIKISDNVLIKLRKQEIIEEVIREAYEKGNSDFKDLVKKYFSKSDLWLYDTVYSIGEAFRKLPQYHKTLRDFESLYFNDEYIKLKASDYLEKLKKKFSKLQVGFLQEYSIGSGIYEETFEDYLIEIKELFNDLTKEQGYDEFINVMLSAKYPRKRRNYDKALVLEQVKSLIKDFKNLKIDCYDDMIESYQETLESSQTIIKLVRNYLLKYQEIQKKESLYSYEDIMFFAIDLFENHSDVRQKYQNTIKEIMIDEYQDTNNLQHYLISLIANNNIFMVGDVKQSIYRFRDANPKNFLRIHDDYLEGKDGKLIFLQENFRSNTYILDFINGIFDQIMTSEIGGIDYLGKQRLITGYDLKDSLHQKDCFQLIAYDDALIKDEHKKLSSEEIEAHLLAQQIVEDIASKRKIYDLKQKRFRKIDYQDITILVDRKKNFSTYAKILSYYAIPIDIYDDEPFFLSDEIIFVFQMLLLMQCFQDEEFFKKNFKTSLFSVARSFVYRIKDSLIIDFLTFETVKDIKDIKKIINYPELKNIYDDITYLNSYSDLPIYERLIMLYNRVNIYERIAYLDNPRKKEEKLDYFLLKVKEFYQFSFADLIKYLDTIISDESLDIEYSPSKQEVNAVKLMSIHKSKGLQFPVVYLMGLSKRFNNTESKETFIFNPDFGLLTKTYNNGFYQNFLLRDFLDRVKEEDLSEKIRLLYVALTRAINEVKILLDYDEETQEDTSFKWNSYRNILLNVFKISQEPVKELNVPSKLTNKNTMDLGEAKLEFKRFEFDRKEKLEKIFSKTVNKHFSDEEIENIKKGNEIHLYLKEFDFENPEVSIELLPENLKSSIKYLINSDVFKSLINPKFFQEYEFYSHEDFLEIHGIIDLLVIADNKILVIDYKLQNIDEDAYESQLKGYFSYLKPRVDKPVYLYLYSLNEKRLKAIE